MFRRKSTLFFRYVLIRYVLLEMALHLIESVIDWQIKFVSMFILSSTTQK